MLASVVQVVVRTAFILTLLRPFNELFERQQAITVSLSFSAFAQLFFRTNHRIVTLEIVYIFIIFALDATFKTSQLNFPLIQKNLAIQEGCFIARNEGFVKYGTDE